MKKMPYTMNNIIKLTSLYFMGVVTFFSEPKPTGDHKRATNEM